MWKFIFHYIFQSPKLQIAPLQKTLQALLGSLKDKSLFLSSDNIIFEKSNKHFELCPKLNDQAAYNGFNQLQGDLYVSLLFSFSVYQDKKILYLSVPMGYLLWRKKKIKLVLATKLAPKEINTSSQNR